MRSRNELAADYAAFQTRGRRALLDGESTHDLPFTEGSPRWGMTTILRPTGPALDRLESLARAAGEAAGPGHWTHGRGVLHVTLRSLEAYRQVIPAADPALLTFAAALRTAARGLPPVRMRVEGVSPHAGGVLAFAYPEDDTIWTLQRRYDEALGVRGAFESWPRERWYISLVHFAAPLTDPKKVVAWCDDHAGEAPGTTEIPAADLAHATIAGPHVRLTTLKRVILDR
ncbi:hypothetical protein ACFWYW_15500 [Nonomuraea sp. NPDC059023]|uniref:hypothetical protein n=1 Tax=unclassified Nonomuraea TaxID=2593643 RepID=UPI0036C5A278